MLRFKLRTEMVPGTKSYTLVLIYLTHLPLAFGQRSLALLGIKEGCCGLDFQSRLLVELQLRSSVPSWQVDWCQRLLPSTGEEMQLM